ncbi:universal stress protein [Halobacillus massiliensis]|uniref:universal stress protein n=1 Tax=Halobacillus massiliensis TaxID=1926286 RepID=UPI0009E3EC83|nr:universal stress protein [Halobacillus massiliensis]
MREKIMAAYDGSEVSKKAIQEALSREASSENTEVHIVSVVNGSGPYTNAVIAEDFNHEILKDVEEDLNKIKRDFHPVHTPIITEVLIEPSESNAGRRLCEYADKHDIDLVIVGNRGLGKVKNFLLGSVSKDVVQNTKCPVLVMK